MPRLLVVLLVAGCSTRNPAFDEPTAGPSTGDATGTTAPVVPPTTGAPTDDGPPTGSADATATATATTADPLDPTSSSTSSPDTDDTTATTAAPCPECGPCETCVAGACAPLGADVACDAPDGAPCEQQVHGLALGACHAYAPGVGRCDGAGACTWACEAQGAALYACDEVCVDPDHNCVQGGPAAAVTLDSLCVLDAETDGCQTSCTVVADRPHHNPYACDAVGACALREGMTVEDCYPGSCELPDGCTLECRSEEDCSKFAMCDEGEGECEEPP